MRKAPGLGGRKENFVSRLTAVLGVQSCAEATSGTQLSPLSVMTGCRWRLATRLSPDKSRYRTSDFGAISLGGVEVRRGALASEETVQEQWQRLDLRVEIFNTG